VLYDSLLQRRAPEFGLGRRTPGKIVIYLTLYLQFVCSALAGYDNSKNLVAFGEERKKMMKGESDWSSFKMMICLAVSGDSTAQAVVSRLFTGKGATKNDAKAFHFASLSAAQECSLGRLRLASLLREGVGCEKDEKKATEVLALAAEKGYTPAMLEHGRRLFQMGSVKGRLPEGELSLDQVSHFEQACLWLKKAINQSRISSLTNR
jgi:TPR repeat protein